MIHIYYGDGKGKTTCGMGLCLRAAGTGRKVLIWQLMKDGSSGERAAMGQVPGIDLIEAPERVLFSFQMSEDEKAEQRAFNNKRLREITDTAIDNGYDLLFLDEALYAVGAALLDEGTLLDTMDRCLDRVELVLTGRDPSDEILKRADYITQFVKEKHPFDRGIAARQGIEF